MVEQPVIMVTVGHLRVARMCSRGARMWFDRHGLDYATFVTKGYPVEVIEATDALGRQVAEIARRQHLGEDD